MKNNLRSNKGSGLGVILYGVTFLLILVFTAINIVNSKVIENGYNSLRDAVLAASSGSVIHLLTTDVEGESRVTQAQKDIISTADYDVYLQLALGYLINRNNTDVGNGTVIQSGEINNFIKLDHQKVVNSTLALLDDAIMRRNESITETEEYKVMMFFIEPYYEKSTNKKYFDIIAYGNSGYEFDSTLGGYTIKKELARIIVPSSTSGIYGMKDVFENVESAIESIVNCEYDGMTYEYDGVTHTYNGMLSADKNRYKTLKKFSINLNSQNSSDYAGLIRNMETYPYYVLVIKDFALPTIFDGKETNDVGGGIRNLFTSLSGDGKLDVPMCALNSGKTQRKLK